MTNIRNERPGDYRSVEALTRRAFYNMYIPGCVEHYLVHIMRDHEDFVPELDFVLELDGKIIGNIMYTRARLLDDLGNEKKTLIKELNPCVRDGRRWRYYGSPVMSISEDEAEKFDAALEKMEKKHLPSQEEFYIMSNSFLD